MYITSIKADGYKNLDGVDIVPDRGINILAGENAQGKTNMIEAIWTMTGCHSFRGTRDRDIIGFEKQRADISLTFEDAVREQSISLAVKKGNIKDKDIYLNGVKVPLLSKLFGTLKCVVFTPEDLSLTKGSPDRRRSFVDLCASQLKPSFVYALNKYNSILSQRNALIKDISAGLAPKDTLGIWDEQLAKTGAYISVIRDIYCRSLNKYASHLYDDITNCKEKLQLYYLSSIYDSIDSTDFEGELSEIYLEKLRASVNEDIRVGYTLYGIHRDDLSIRIDGLLVRDFGSQGQQRSAAIAMKAAQAQIIRDECKDPPVMLLDDVLSELDAGRREFILGRIPGMQVFITTCELLNDMPKGAKIFRVEKGKIISNR